MKIHIEKRSPSPTEYQKLRASTSWAQIDIEQTSIALRNDLFGVCIFVDTEIAGIARVIGDGAIYFYIQDLIVLPKFQKMGLAKKLMDEIEKYLSKTTGMYAFIGLMAAVGVASFYEEYGYEKRPDNAPGMSKSIYRK